MSEELDKILKDIQKRKTIAHAEMQDQVEKQRQEKISGFKLELDLEDEIPVPAVAKTANSSGDYAANPPSERLFVETAEELTNIPAKNDIFSSGLDAESLPPTTDRPLVEKKKKKQTAAERIAWGWSRAFLYLVLVIGVSGILIFVGITGSIDLLGFNKSEAIVRVTITQEHCDDTAKLAKLLDENGIIDQPFMFNLYCKFTDKTAFSPREDVPLQASMGYEAVINALKTVKNVSVKVMFQEGMTAREIAARLEENGICPADEFIDVLNKGTFAQSFLADVPDGGEYDNRFVRFEGFLFPDTYEFYVDEKPENVANKFLTTFSNRVDINLRIKMKNEGVASVYDTIIMASIIEWEATKPYMTSVSRVLHNRLNPATGLPRLQCDATYRYLDQYLPWIDGARQTEHKAYTLYNTDVCVGLPLGPICNPGLDAINAALNPSTEAKIMKANYFATDRNDEQGTTYFSNTLAEHEAICRRYKIGAYG